MEARAKINLTLEVFGKRADGFHDLRSLVVQISLADEIALRPSEEITLCVTEAVSGVADQIGPTANNLAVRAVQLMQRVSGRTDGVAIDLVKRIPIGSPWRRFCGCGGSSAWFERFVALAHSKRRTGASGGGAGQRRSRADAGRPDADGRSGRARGARAGAGTGSASGAGVPG